MSRKDLFLPRVISKGVLMVTFLCWKFNDKLYTMEADESSFGSMLSLEVWQQYLIT